VASLCNSAFWIGSRSAWAHCSISAARARYWSPVVMPYAILTDAPVCRVNDQECSPFPNRARLKNQVPFVGLTRSLLNASYRSRGPAHVIRSKSPTKFLSISDCRTRREAGQIRRQISAREQPVCRIVGSADEFASLKQDVDAVLRRAMRKRDGGYRRSPIHVLPGLGRPSTSCLRRSRTTWMPGMKPCLSGS